MPTDREQRTIQETDGSVLTVEESAGKKTQDGTVLVHLMRPCLGKGRGRHIYEAQMLERETNAGRFKNWPMYVDHRSPEAARKAQGLPRSLRDLGGRVVEAWWDPQVPADKEAGFGAGAVVAEAKPVPWVKELIDHDPQLVNVSLNTFATGVVPRTMGGRPAYVVEGFADEGSADWVTKPGAGGRVVELLEAAMDAADAEDEPVLETVSDEDLADHIRRHRPELAEALTTPTPGSGEEDIMETEQIQEATLEVLQSDAGKAAITAVVSEAATDAVSEALKNVLPEAIGAAAATIEEGARVAANQEVRRGRLTEQARKEIAEAKLPEKFEAASVKRVTEAIASIDDKRDPEDESKVTESAEDQVKALVETEIKDQKDLIGSVAPTRVSNPGGGSDDTVTEEDGEVSPYLDSVMETAGVDMEAAYGVKKVDAAKPAEKDKGDAEADKETAAA
jgi:hypothetical protein